jgi:hypothetical protein
MSGRKNGPTEWRRLAGKPRWCETDARLLIGAWRESGQSIEAFARDVGIGSWKLRYWLPRLSTPVSAAASDRVGHAQRLVPAVVTVGGNGRGPTVVVRLPDGVEVEIHDVAQVEADEIGRLVASLRRSGS